MYRASTYDVMKSYLTKSPSRVVVRYPHHTMVMIRSARVISHVYTFGTPRVMGAIESLSCNWWSNMHQIDA